MRALFEDGVGVCSPIGTGILSSPTVLNFVCVCRGWGGALVAEGPSLGLMQLWFLTNSHIHLMSGLKLRRVDRSHPVVWSNMYVYRFQNVFLRCPTPRLHCFLSSHWPSFRFLSFMAFLIPSIQFFRSSSCSLVSVSTSTLFWVIFLLPFFEHGGTKTINYTDYKIITFV